jgi:Flp pilus assembly pilin Flp
MKSTGKSFRDIRGAALLEYGIVVGLVSVVAIVAVSNVGVKVEQVFSHSENELGVARAHFDNTAEGAPEAPEAPAVNYTDGSWSFSQTGFHYTGPSGDKTIGPGAEDISVPLSNEAFNTNNGMLYGVDLGGVGAFYRAHVDDDTLEKFGSAYNWDFGGMHWRASTGELLTVWTGQYGGDASQIANYTSTGQQEIAVVAVDPVDGSMRAVAQARFTEVTGDMSDWDSSYRPFVDVSDSDGYTIRMTNVWGDPDIVVSYDEATDQFTRQ